MAVLRTLIGDALRTTRLRQDRTLREVSAAARVSLGYLSEVERGQKEASSELLASICRALGVRLSDVLREVSESLSVLEPEPASHVDAVADDQPWKLVIIAMLAVGREGLETALILWAATQTASRGTAPNHIPLLGAVLGIAVATLLGYLLYRGAVKINLTRFFTVTGTFLILVAAGVLSYGVHDLQEARFLPGLSTLAYDVSHVISLDGVLGTLLKGIFNFSPAATVLEVVVWVGYTVPVMILFFRRLHPRSTTPPQPVVSMSSATLPAKELR